MPNIALSGPEVPTQLDNADMYWFQKRQSSFASSFYNKIGHPFLTTADGTKASMVKYRDRIYGVGGFGSHWVFDEHYRIYKQTIPAPTSPPSVSTTAGGVSCIAYLTFYDSNTNERSSLSGGFTFTWNNSANRTWTLPTYVQRERTVIRGDTTANATTTITGSGTQFFLLRVGDKIALSSAPTVFATITAIASNTSLTVDQPLGDGTTQEILAQAYSRASHVELWLSVDGADPRFVTRRQLGATTAVEAVATLALGEVAPDDFSEFPKGAFNAIYHDRQIISGDAKNPDTVYLSEIFFPERYAGVSFRTRNGERVTGLLPCRDVLLVFTASSTYRLQGYTEDDFELVLDDPDIGCITHFGLAVIYGNAWTPDQKGIFMWNGSYHQMLDNNKKYWQLDYKRHPADYEDGFAVHDPNEYTYTFFMNRYIYSLPEDSIPNDWPFVDILQDARCTLGWVGNYEETTPQVEGTYGQAKWSFDFLDRIIPTAGVLSDAGGKRTDVYFGACDGLIRTKDIFNADDDGDLYGKRFIVQTKHYYFDDPGGKGYDGKRLLEFWSYLESEHTNWTVAVIGGDEKAWYKTMVLFENDQVQGVAPFLELWPELRGIPYRRSFNVSGADWYDEVAGTWAFTLDGSPPVPNETVVPTPPYSINVYVPQTVHVHAPEKVSGRGFTFIYFAATPVKVEFRGVGGIYGPAPATRKMGLTVTAE